MTPSIWVAERVIYKGLADQEESMREMFDYGDTKGKWNSFHSVTDEKDQEIGENSEIKAIVLLTHDALSQVNILSREFPSDRFLI